MHDANEKKGKCLCGAVHISATAMSKHVGACHCGMCRKWTGGPLLAVDCGSDVAFTGKESVSTFGIGNENQRRLAPGAVYSKKAPGFLPHT